VDDSGEYFNFILITNLEKLDSWTALALYSELELLVDHSHVVFFS
jgi:hypothetical protein